MCSAVFNIHSTMAYNKSCVVCSFLIFTSIQRHLLDVTMYKIKEWMSLGAEERERGSWKGMGSKGTTSEQ